MKAIRIIGVLLILIMLSGIVSAAYTTYAHPAFKIRDGRDSNLVGTTLGNGFLIDVTCTSNCTGFGSGTNTTDEDIRNVTSDFLVAGAGINLSRDDANDTLTITNTAIGGVSNFYLYNNSVMNTTLNTNGEKSTTVSYGTDDYLLKSWESPAVNITSTGEGIAEVHIHLSEAAASKGSQVYAKWFKNVSGVETLIATSGMSAVIGTSSIAYEINKAVEIQPVNTSDTFIIRLYGNITGTGGNASITIYTEGTTFSRFELPVPVVTGVAGAAGADGDSFSLNVSGEAALTNNATLVAGSNITLTQTGNNITIASSGGTIYEIGNYTGDGASNRAIITNLTDIKYVVIQRAGGVLAFTYSFYPDSLLFVGITGFTVATPMNETTFYTGDSDTMNLVATEYKWIAYQTW